MTDRLNAIGDDLERATARSLRTHARRRRRTLTGAVAVALLVPGAAVAGSLLTTEDVERSLPAGTLFLAGTTPECETVKDGVEYLCTIHGDFTPELADMKGTVEATVDSTSHVNGGCRSLRADGREWRCYIGKEAVRQNIIDAGFLGEYSSGPAVG